MKEEDRKRLGKHGYSGKCAPAYEGEPSHFGTFSLGIFEWVAKDNGRGVKRGSVKVRVVASTGCRDRAYAKAEEVARALDVGAYSGPKRVVV